MRGKRAEAGQVLRNCAAGLFIATASSNVFEWLRRKKKELGLAGRAGIRGTCWHQGDVLASGGRAGIRGMCWQDRDVLAGHEQASRRGTCWQGRDVLAE